MKFFPELSEARKIAETGQYDVLPVSCEILSDFTSSNELCEEFINREMSSLQLSV